MILSLFTFQLLRNFTTLIKFYGKTEPIMVNRQGSDTNQMAEQKRFELLLGYKPTDGFQDRSLEPLGYCSIALVRKKATCWDGLLCFNGGRYRV